MKRSYPNWLNWVLILAIALGVCFRFLDLDRKLFWHDEVYTSMRAAGYSSQDIDQEAFQNRIVPAAELLKYQRIRPNSTAADTVRSLAIQDPQHPPFYFLIARVWMQWFGGAITASRSLPALLSLLSLPLMYALAMELFAAPLVALLATALVALSPFDILFAQVARQYELLATLVIGSTWLLVKAVRGRSRRLWGLYALSVTLGLYTHVFYALTMIAHGCYVLLLSIFGRGQAGRLEALATQPAAIPSESPKGERWRWIWGYAIANVVALLLYSPWLNVLIGNSQRAFSTTDWGRVAAPITYLAKLWLLSFTSLFFDLDAGFDNPLTYLGRLPFLLLIVAGAVAVYRRTPRITSWVLLTSLLIPFLLLALPDVIMGGRRSAVTRYLISCFPAVQLIVAFVVGIGLDKGKPVWRGVLVLMLTASIVTCSVRATAETWWHNIPSYFNADIARLVNAEAEQSLPIIVSDSAGYDGTSIGDLIALSYRLKDNVRLYLTQKTPNLDPIAQEADVLVYRPSADMRKAIAQKGWQITVIDQTDGQLWRLKQ
jgi:uncharacterized membrane protein